jgi:hypothetical protein
LTPFTRKGRIIDEKHRFAREGIRKNVCHKSVFLSRIERTRLAERMLLLAGKERSGLKDKPVVA